MADRAGASRARPTLILLSGGKVGATALGWGNLAATSVAGGNSIREFFFNLSPLRERGASSIDSLRSGASRTFHQDLRRVEGEEGGRGNDGIFRGRPVSIVAVGRGRLSWLATYEFYISCYNIILPGFWFL